MKNKSTKNVNNNVIKKVCVLFFLLNLVFAQDKIELKQADSLSSIQTNNETLTSLRGNIIFKKGYFPRIMLIIFIIFLFVWIVS